MKSIIQHNAKQAFLAAFLIVTLLCSFYFMVEPRVGRAVTSNPHDFTIRQEIVGEISFLVEAADVTMAGQLSGITGGTATGTTQAVVQTNSPSGYYMTIAFDDADGDGTIMKRDLPGTATSSIKNYATSTYNIMIEPSYLFSIASTASMFAYTVTASSATDVDASFRDSGSACGSGTAAGNCWMAPTTTAFRIIDRGTSAGQGATSTITFKVYVPNNPNPAVETGFYTATATLTAVNNS